MGVNLPSVQAKGFLADVALPGTRFSTRKKMVPLRGRASWHGAGHLGIHDLGGEADSLTKTPLVASKKELLRMLKSKL